MAKQDSGTDDLIDWLEGKKKAKQPPKPESPPDVGPAGQVPPAAPEDEPGAAKKPEEGRKPEGPPAPPRGVPTEPPPKPPVVEPESPRPQPEAAPAPGPPEAEGDRPTAGGATLPKNLIAHFLLVNIGGPVKKTRTLPRYLPLTKARTLAGRYISAHIHLDDESTVQPKHAKIIYEEREAEQCLVIYPIDQASVLVNGGPVPSDGRALQSGDLVKIGSANLIFFQKTLKGTDL